MNAPSCSWHPVERQRTIYSHLETDEEFRDRLRRAGHSQITVYPLTRREGESFIQMRARLRRIGETDNEFARRASTKVTLSVHYFIGADLDDKVWEALRIQRRIVQVVPS